MGLMLLGFKLDAVVDVYRLMICGLSSPLSMCCLLPFLEFLVHCRLLERYVYDVLLCLTIIL
jgi:hypothetical protein